MKAFVLAAGLGTRLRPWTLSHPKALVPVGGVPMLERVINSLMEQGFDRIVVNVHHFSGQIIDFLKSRDFYGGKVAVSDESDLLLDTGGGLAKAASLLLNDDEPVLVHNVDILSNADLGQLMAQQNQMQSRATLLISHRDSSRQLYFDRGMNLHGWQNLKSSALKPEGFTPTDATEGFAFSGIHAVSAPMLRELASGGYPEVFPIMDYYLSHTGAEGGVKGFYQQNLDLIDIGKPESLTRADNLFS